MELYYSLTSPYARIVRAALLEKQLDDRVKHHVVDPWSDDTGLMRVNPATRVPTLVAEDGTAITESLLIVQYLEGVSPESALIPANDRAQVLGETGMAMGIIDAGVQTLLARKFGSPEAEQGVLGQRRLRTINNTLDRLESRPPDVGGRLGALAVAIALQYLDFRFPEVAWDRDRPQLAHWHAAVEERPALTQTVPRTG